MKLKYKLTMSIMVLCVLVLTLVGTVYAWLSMGDTTSSMVFKIAKIDSEVTLSKIVDSNLNGVPDYSWNEGEDPLIDKPHFTYQQIGKQFAYQEESATIEMAMIMENMLPTQVHTYSLNIVNKSDADNVIRVTFTNYKLNNYKDNNGNNLYTLSDFDNFISRSRVMSVRIGIVQAEGGIIYGDKSYFATARYSDIKESLDSNNPDVLTTTGRGCNFTIASNIQVQSALLQTNNNTIELFVQFEFEPLADINEAITLANHNKTEGQEDIPLLTEEDYLSYQGINFKLPIMGLYLEIIDVN